MAHRPSGWAVRHVSTPGGARAVSGMRSCPIAQRVIWLTGRQRAPPGPAAGSARVSTPGGAQAVSWTRRCRRPCVCGLRVGILRRRRPSGWHWSFPHGRGAARPGSRQSPQFHFVFRVLRLALRRAGGHQHGDSGFCFEGSEAAGRAWDCALFRAVTITFCQRPKNELLCWRSVRPT